jgi:hypothetical protein
VKSKTPEVKKMGEFKVWTLLDDQKTRTNIRRIRAYSHKKAAEKWATQQDGRPSAKNAIATKLSLPIVYVQERGADHSEKFQMTGELHPVYYACSLE